ncbi:WXG100 family type VII secretion target [Mycobacteroides abscessus subsp. abscessus]|uniref:WXG100 family type VII secretion target n=1 Tax=Mycobacteroides abscessus TaxID=36809 RepID=UPI00266CFD2F|nr:WXG100 family type VII secretion target [Mycobacteroides abscessus]MDO3019347.1 WXG100 family type VII secretion target [Mycobacteroides abscessus subsp. abscessus]
MAVPGSGSDDALYLQYAGVISSAQDIDDVNTEIKGAFDRLKTEGDEVVGGSWTGTAASKLDEGWQQWQRGVHEITGALDWVLGQVTGAATTFKTIDDQGLK